MEWDDRNSNSRLDRKMNTPHVQVKPSLWRGRLHVSDGFQVDSVVVASVGKRRIGRGRGRGLVALVGGTSFQQ